MEFSTMARGFLSQRGLPDPYLPYWSGALCNDRLDQLMESKSDGQSWSRISEMFIVAKQVLEEE